jgi:hypothetical protein
MRERVPESTVDWPAGWTPRFTIFVDVEEEFDWSKPFSRDARGTTAMPALLPFARAMAARGVGVTYLVDHPVATCPRAIEVLRRIVALPGAEIGTQLHPWVNPPHDEAVTSRNSYVGSLPETLEAAKLDVLTEAITAAVGVRPRAYRAGRYGIGPNSFRLLAERGYRLDTSERTGFDYRADGGPDFRLGSDRAYRLTEDLLELPLTTVHTGRWRRGGPWLYGLAGRVPKLRGVLSRTGLLSRIPLTPEGTTASEAVDAIEQAVADGLPILNFSFHSPSLVPGHTPYVRTGADLAKLHAWFDTALACLDRLGVRPASLADLLAAACPSPSVSATPAVGVGL